MTMAGKTLSLLVFADSRLNLSLHDAIGDYKCFKQKMSAEIYLISCNIYLEYIKKRLTTTIKVD